MKISVKGSILVLVMFVFFTACTSTSTPPETGEKTELFSYEDWVQNDTLQDLNLWHPKNWTLQGGGDVDSGSWSWLFDESNEPIFGFFNLALMTCEFEDPALCNLGTNIPASNLEVYERELDLLMNDEEYTYVGEMNHFKGVKFMLNEPNLDGTLRSRILILGENSVYYFDDLREENAGTSPLDEVLAALVVN